MNRQSRRFLCGAPALLLAGCGPDWSNHSPTVDVVGSYFPAWLVCIVAGLLVTLIAQWVFIGSRLHAHVGPKGIVYPCMFVLSTLSVWLFFFQN